MQEGQLAIEVRVIVTLTIGIKRPGLAESDKRHKGLQCTFCTWLFHTLCQEPLIGEASSQRAPSSHSVQIHCSITSKPREASCRAWISGTWWARVTVYHSKDQQQPTSVYHIHSKHHHLPSRIPTLWVQRKHAAATGQSGSGWDDHYWTDENDRRVWCDEKETWRWGGGADERCKLMTCRAWMFEKWSEELWEVQVQAQSGEFQQWWFWNTLLYWIFNMEDFYSFFNSLEPYDLQYVGRDRTFPPRR